MRQDLQLPTKSSNYLSYLPFTVLCVLIKASFQLTPKLTGAGLEVTTLQALCQSSNLHYYWPFCVVTMSLKLLSLGLLASKQTEAGLDLTTLKAFCKSSKPLSY